MQMEEITQIRQRRNFADFTAMEFGQVWKRAKFELGDMLGENTPSYEDVCNAVEEVLQRHFILLKVGRCRLTLWNPC